MGASQSAPARSFTSVDVATLSKTLQHYQITLERLYTDFVVLKCILLEVASAEATMVTKKVDGPPLTDAGAFLETISSLVKELNYLQMHLHSQVLKSILNANRTSFEVFQTHSDSFGQLLENFHASGDMCLYLIVENKRLTAKHTELLTSERKLLLESTEQLKVEKDLRNDRDTVTDMTTKVIKICEDQNVLITELKDEIKRMQNASGNHGCSEQQQVGTADPNVETTRLQQSVSQLGKDLDNAKKSGFNLATLLGQRVDSSKRVSELETELKHARAETKQLKKEASNISETRKTIKALANHLGVADVEALRAEITRLKNQDNRFEALRNEISELKSKNANIKDVDEHLRRVNVDLEERLHRANLELEKRRSSSNDDGDGGPSAKNTDTEAETSDVEELTISVAGLSFSDGAAKTLQHHKTLLRGLRKQVSGMKDVRGGTGWSIVDRSEAMVKKDTTRMLKGIDNCLALRGDAQREKERVEQLETCGFPALQATVSEATHGGNDGMTLVRKKSKKILKKQSMVNLN